MSVLTRLLPGMARPVIAGYLPTPLSGRERSASLPMRPCFQPGNSLPRTGVLYDPKALATRSAGRRLMQACFLPHLPAYGQPVPVGRMTGRQYGAYGKERVRMANLPA